MQRAYALIHFACVGPNKVRRTTLIVGFRSNHNEIYMFYPVSDHGALTNRTYFAVCIVVGVWHFPRSWLDITHKNRIRLVTFVGLFSPFTICMSCTSYAYDVLHFAMVKNPQWRASSIVVRMNQSIHFVFRFGLALCPPYLSVMHCKNKAMRYDHALCNYFKLKPHCKHNLCAVFGVPCIDVRWHHT